MRPLPDQTSDSDRLGLKLGQGVEELFHSPAGVDDVLHDEDVLATNRGLDVLHPDDSDV